MIKALWLFAPACYHESRYPIPITKGGSMKDVYQRLAEHLDSLPAGFPAATSG